ncbi:helix-turn-helix domain-containing protein [Streptomyces sp. 3MP-14]|uniref:Helix-turn-helix domain-containing protein n=1 Tax=Streptomyces mimosae TaxID=2586635 RepID=A0A5N6A4E9_9ACTN|nr:MULTISPECIES: helix-turn-helix domain-containing protein [Streptomyces]KAB8162883.1 helix-turn-helix domain-containing protein [Streptomyces mimosae]KAB8179096.1 helix-turn-helix domain-containing protein [Streptomyces sp. 3MP-14]
MGLSMECRDSDSPWVAQVWRSTSARVDSMTSVASPHWELVIWEEAGRVNANLQGPESRASIAPVPQDATFFGITFALGTWMPHLAVSQLVDSSAPLPDTTRRSFYLRGSAWHLPTFDNAEAFVRRLVREDILVSDPVVTSVLAGREPEVSARTAQRRFVASTGLTRGAIRQIERAREAALLIQGGAPAGEVVHRLGYFDQPHLARSLSRFVGRTATQLSARTEEEAMSLPYKTGPLDSA